jgi:membrane protein
MKGNIADRIKAIYSRINDLTGGSLSILGHTFQSFSEARAPEVAASMAYYTIFSLFPLLLVLIAAGSFVLERQAVQQAVLKYTAEAFPTSQQLIQKNLEQVLNLRGAVGIVGLVGLLWSASGVFTTLAFNINLAWEKAALRGFVKRRLLGVAMVGLLALLLALSFVSSTVLNILSRFDLPLRQELGGYETYLLSLLSSSLPWLLTFLIFLSLYRWVPNTEVKWSAALGGGLVAAIAWGLAKDGFTWYLTSGFGQYQLVYGSLGTIIALMFWIYLGSLIILFGAHLSAAIAQHT